MGQFFLSKWIFALIAVQIAFYVQAQTTAQAKKQPEDALAIDNCTADDVSDYSMAWHIASVFIIFGSSGLGIFTTLLIGIKSKSKIMAQILQVSKMFGIGIIAATGWCHLIPDAFDAFTSPCLGEGWQSYGAAFVGVFALAASFAIQLIELVGPGHASAPSPRVADDPVEFDLNVGQALPAGHGQPLQLESQYHEHGKNMSTAILEAGILFHSLVIGLTLGVMADLAQFQTLMIAICFHQLFEGMALGALISKMNRGTWFKFLVPGLLYPMTTPIGIAIGIAVHQHYNANAGKTIVIQGIFNSLSAGILLYNTYAELMSTEVNHNRTFRKFTKTFKFVNMMAMYTGAGVMALLAKWA